MRRRPSRWKTWTLSCTLSAAAALGFAPAARAAAGPNIQPAGPPIAVTADPAGALFPGVASDPAGNFAVVWIGREQADSTSSVLVRRFDATGRPLGAEIVVASGVRVASRPRIAIGSGGGMVVWSDYWRVRARRLAPDGQPVGGVIAVSTDDNNFKADPDVAILRSGGFAVVWHWIFLSYFEPIPPTDDLRARLFDAEGTALGDDFMVSFESVDKSQPRVAADPAGGFAVVWEEIAGYSFEGAPLEVRRFAADGTPRGPEVQVTAGRRSFSPVPLFTAGGELSVAWADLGGDSFSHPSGLYAQRFAADGSLLGEELKLADGPLLETPLDAAEDRLGHRLLVWGTAADGSNTETEIHARLFDSAWQPLQPPLRAGRLFPRTTVYAETVIKLPPWPVVASGTAGFLAAWDGRAAPLAPPPSPSPDVTPSQVAGQILAGTCVGGAGTLCLQQDRFEIEVAWKDPRSGASGTATAVPLTGDTGAFWFFSPDNAELLVKVLDGRPVNGHWWVFFGALTDLEYDVTVTDAHTGVQKVYHNPPYVFASRADVDAFADSGAPAASPAALLAPGKAAAVSEGCPSGACLGAFQVSIEWIDPKTGVAHQASGVPLSDGSAYFWFFDPSNIELIVKVLDGHAVNGHWWVFYGALTDVEYTLRVDWPDQHLSRSYHNPAHHMESHGDTQAFP